MPRLRLVLAVLLLASTILGAFVLTGGLLLTRPTSAAWHEDATAHGRLALRDGLPFLELSGSAPERGQAQGGLVGQQIDGLLAVMRLNPRATLKAGYLDGCIAAMRPDDRRELAEMATAAGIAEHDLLIANSTVETMCSAVVNVPGPGGHPVLARNMDFFPPGPLGKATLVQVVREPGRRTYAAVSWPGMIGVISGLNDARLSACILLNWHGDRLPPGEPLPLRVREVLRTCSDVEEALRCLGGSMPASSHYVLLADANAAALAWWGRDGLHVDRPRGGWLVATNLPRADGEMVLAGNPRGAALVAAITTLGGTEPDAAWFRRITSISCMVGLNAQAMVIDPAQRRLELALADDWSPAAHRPWRVIDLDRVLGGASLDEITVTRLPAERPMPHYLLGGGD